jgi:hypothetical protein
LFTSQRELEFITPTLLDTIVLDDEHNIASARARLSKERLPRPETLEKGQWYLQRVPEAAMVKKCQALYSTRLCGATLPQGVFALCWDVNKSAKCIEQVPGALQ